VRLALDQVADAQEPLARGQTEPSARLGAIHRLEPLQVHPVAQHSQLPFVETEVAHFVA